ncbi:helix-turn-helix domain-containing protein [Aquiflexum gelatinilyticum]|uniref:helix-turn-helix domain-containing protein n=1 Tax=Aquiflexum gelatinilyticum TaxID=2961943 RepID=UPI00216816F3|nr:AraC family transcriptional regulator [Aquiflexum gelatinilyticum]MCS4436297.1 AraC family transcriptional regulator [Aquiflexum gelatinilyticum]
MEVSLDWKNFFYIFSQFVGFLVGVVLIFFGFRKNRQNILLGFNFLVLTYSSFIIWLITTSYFVYFPQLYRTGNFTGLLFMPMMYLYIRMVVTGKKLHWKDAFHLIIPFVFLVDYWPVLLLESSEKLALIKSEISNPALFTSFNQSRFFPDGFYTPFRSFVLSIYWILSVYWVRKGSMKIGKEVFSKEWFAWIKVFLVLEFLVFFPFFLLFWTVDPITAFHLVHIAIVLLNLSTAFSLLFFPKILYGLDKDLFFSHLKKQKSKTEILENLSKEKSSEIETKIKVVLEDQKKYLQHSYSIHDLSDDTGIPTYLLTLYINNVLNTSFTDLINKKRIEECCQLMASRKYSHLAIEGFAKLSGFNNRNSFSLAFKKFKDMSPSAYYKTQIN